MSYNVININTNNYICDIQINDRIYPVFDLSYHAIQYLTNLHSSQNAMEMVYKALKLLIPDCSEDELKNLSLDTAINTFQKIKDISNSKRDRGITIYPEYLH